MNITEDEKVCRQGRKVGNSFFCYEVVLAKAHISLLALDKQFTICGGIN